MLNERDRLYADLIVHLANAKTTDDAVQTFFQDVQKLFSFSPDFLVTARNLVPTLTSYKSLLSNAELELLQLLVEEVQLYQEGERQQWNIYLQYYDYEDELFEFSVSLDQFDHDFDDYKIKVEKSKQHFLRRLEKVVNEHFMQPSGLGYATKHDGSMSNESQTEEKVAQAKKDAIIRLTNYCDKHIALGIKILNRKKTISKARFEEIRIMSDGYLASVRWHRHFNQMTNQMASCLNNVMRKEKYNSSSIVNSLMNIFNHTNKPAIYISDSNEISENPLVSETDFFNHTNRKWIEYEASGDDPPYGDCFCECHKVIAHSFINLFRNPANRIFVKRCPICDRFFLSKTIRESKYCTDKCRLSFHNKKRIESGEHASYKRNKRKEGAKESYYG